MGTPALVHVRYRRIFFTRYIQIKLRYEINITAILNLNLSL